MPLNVYTPFTAPQLIAQGGRDLGAGISGGLEGLSDGISKAMEKRKREGKLSDQYGKLIETAFPNMADVVKTWSLEQKQGFVEGEALKSHRARVQQEAEAMAEKLAERKAAQALSKRLGELTTVRPESPELGDYYENPENYPQGMPQRLPVTGDRVLEAATDTGTLMNPQLDNILSALERKDRLSPIGGAPVTHQLEGGYLGFTLPGTRNLDVRPDLSKQNMDPVEDFDEEGNLIARRFPTGRGGYTVRTTKPKATGQLQPVLDPITKQSVPGFGMDAAGTVHDLRTVKQKAGIGEPPAKPAKAEPARPRTQAEYDALPAGTDYIDDKGQKRTKK